MTLSLAAFAIAAVATKGDLCFLDNGCATACRPTSAITVAVEPSEQRRFFVWRSGGNVRLGVVQPRDSSLRLDDPGTGRLKLAISAPQTVTPTMQIDGGGASWTIENANGTLTIDLPPAVRYDVTIQAGGLDPIKLRRVHIAQGKIADLAVITLRRSPEISGTVVARKDGAPLPGATIVDGAGKLLARTDQNGHFRFPRRDATLQTINVGYPGYATHVVRLGDALSDRELETIQLADGFTLTVTIDAVPHHGAPTVVKRARLFQTTTGILPAPVLVAETSVDDRIFEFDGLEAGVYGVEVSGDGPLERFVVPVEVTASQSIDVTVRPLDITVAAFLGDAIQENTTIELAALRNLWRTTINTGSTGEYKGRLWQRGLIAAQVHLQQSQFQESRTIDAQYEDAWDIKIPDQRIIGTVVDADTHRPLADAGVRYDFLGEETTIYGARVIVNEDGQFSLFGARSGEYKFHATAPEHTVGDPVTVTVERGTKERHVEIALRGEVSRTVVFVDAATGAPIAEAPVCELQPDGQHVSRVLTTDDTGVVRIGVQGKETKTVYILPVTGSVGVAHIAPAGGDTPLRVEVLPPSAMLHIKTQSSTGAPVTRCKVLLRINGETIPEVIMSFFASLHQVAPHSGSDGDLSLPGMPPGAYELWPYRGAAPPPAAPPVRANVEPGPSTIVLTFGE